MKKRLLTQKYYCNINSEKVPLTEKQCALISRAASLEELYDIMQDTFFVIHSVRSLKHPKRLLEGTRVALRGLDPEGFEFTIRTPGTPERWVRFTEELAGCFHRLVDALAAYSSSEGEARDSDDVKKRALELYYYWVTFSPLTRGTAVCGIVALFAALQSCGLTLQCKHPCIDGSGYTVCDEWPHGVQLDWEAIFADSCGDFVESVSPWINVVVSRVPFMSSFDKREFNNLAGTSGGADCHSDLIFVSVEESIGTMRQMMEILNLGSQRTL
jgi:hypothetical protein